MSMMAEFFDIRKDSRALFEGLSISRNKELCKVWMNQYPTVFLSFRTVDGDDFKQAYGMLQETISSLIIEHSYLLESDAVHPIDRDTLLRLANRNGALHELKSSLLIFTRTISKHFGKPVILLVDEYDVPLAKASVKGYYKEMLSTMRGVMSVLKDNRALNFAVVTGCLQIVKESIFTGTNNFVTDTASVNKMSTVHGM